MIMEMFVNHPAWRNSGRVVFNDGWFGMCYTDINVIPAFEFLFPEGADYINGMNIGVRL